MSECWAARNDILLLKASRLVFKLLYIHITTYTCVMLVFMFLDYIFFVVVVSSFNATGTVHHPFLGFCLFAAASFWC